MPPPALTKLVKSALWAARLVELVSSLSQPPQRKSEATAMALNLVTSNSADVMAAALLGSTLVKGMPSAVRLLVNSVPWSKVRTFSVGLGAPERAKFDIAVICAPALLAEPAA